jgi:hypothetical protein
MKWSPMFTSAATFFLASAMMLLAAQPSGAYWVHNGTAVCDSDSTQSVRALAPDGSGGAIVVWHDARDEPSYLGLYAQRVNQRGELQWPIGGI